MTFSFLYFQYITRSLYTIVVRIVYEKTIESKKVQKNKQNVSIENMPHILYDRA